MTELPTLRALSRTEFTIAQAFLATAFLADVLAIFVGALGIVKPSLAGWASVALALLALLEVWTRGQSDHFAGMANSIHRRLDLHDGLGREIAPLTRMDLLDDAPELVRRLAARTQDEPYFGSEREPSPDRLLENLRESAWWTKRLAGDMATIAKVVLGALLVVGVTTLVVGVNGLVSPDVASRSATWLSAVILLVIGQSPHQAQRKYSELREGAARVQGAADSALQRGGPTETQAVELAAEYHLIRQGAPLVPTAWYNLRRDGLNRLWETSFQANS